MEDKRKSLLISISLSIFLGCIVPKALLTTDSIEKSFDTFAEVVCFYDHLLNLKETSVSEYDIFLEINEGDALRHFITNKRANNNSSAKEGLSSIKKDYTPYTSSLIRKSTPRFLFGLGEGRKRLIYFGVLII